MKLDLRFERFEVWSRFSKVWLKFGEVWVNFGKVLILVRLVEV